jgi:hypothetical protein
MAVAPAAEAGPKKQTNAQPRGPARKQAGKAAVKTAGKGSSSANRVKPGPPSERNTRRGTASTLKSATADLRYGTPVPGKKGFVTSPFAPDSGYIDVREFPPGSQVRDPYTGKIFLTP